METLKTVAGWAIACVAGVLLFPAVTGALLFLFVMGFRLTFEAMRMAAELLQALGIV